MSENEGGCEEGEIPATLASGEGTKLQLPSDYRYCKGLWFESCGHRKGGGCERLRPSSFLDCVVGVGRD